MIYSLKSFAAIQKLVAISLVLWSVLWIRIRIDPELLPGSEIIVPDADPAKS